MKILHLNTYARKGGAALGTLFLHQGLRAAGVESILATRDGGPDPDRSIIQAPERPMGPMVRNLLNRVLCRVYPEAELGKFSYAQGATVKLRALLAEVKPAILHVHWINDGFLDPRALAGLPIPVVVTLRDFWFITGGCHYLAGCDRLRAGCGKCPLLHSASMLDLSRYQLWGRQRVLVDKNIHFVAISRWMAERIGEASSKKISNIRVIPNCISFEDFVPSCKLECRRELGLPENALVVLYPSLYPWSDVRKGGHLLLEALACMPQERGEIVLLCCDGEPPESLKSGCSIRSLPQADGGGVEMNRRYGAADIVVVPSLEEAFGKVSAEALACGRPVVAFEQTGAEDILDHGDNGFLAENGSSESLREGLLWGIRRSSDHPDIAPRLRQSALSRFSADIVANRYLDLYRSLL